MSINNKCQFFFARRVKFIQVTSSLKVINVKEISLLVLYLVSNKII